MNFIDALSNAGLIVDSLIADGEIHRCATRSKPRSKNGWYSIHPSNNFAIFGNWENGDGYDKWVNGELSVADYTAMRETTERIKREREAAYESAAQEASDFYYHTAKSEGFSDYLKYKRSHPHGAKFHDKCLIIPCQDAKGKIWSYQRIYADGSKYFMLGGRVAGCYFPLFSRNVAKDELVVVCEGFATGAAITQETGLPVIVAFNAGNLKAVCDSIEFRNLIIAADNDESGAGEKAARESGYKYVMPKVEGWDYSDVYLNGKEFKSDFIAKKETEVVACGITHDCIVTDIANWITSTAVRPQPELSLAAAIAFMGMVKGHRVAGGTNLRTNMLCLSLAPTASGKEYPQFAINKLADAVGLSKHIAGRPTSGTGLLTGISKAGGVNLVCIDEIGRYIGNITAKGSGGFQREIADYMVELFSSAGRTFKGRQYANEKTNPQVIIEQPHFCCLGSTVEERLQAACSSAEVVDGFLNRWLVFSSNVRPKKNRVDDGSNPPDELVKRIMEWMDSFPIVSDNYGNMQQVKISFTPEAWEIFKAFDDKMEKEIDAAKYPADKLYSRSAEHVEKLAMILTDDEFIGVGEVNMAISIVERSNDAIMRFTGMIADNLSEQDFIRVKEKIREAKEIKRSELTYRCQFVQGGARRIAEIVQNLLDENIISERKDGNKTFYKWIG
jgi:putative DNA primase/helicase